MAGLIKSLNITDAILSGFTVYLLCLINSFKIEGDQNMPRVQYCLQGLHSSSSSSLLPLQTFLSVPSIVSDIVRL